MYMATFQSEDRTIILPIKIRLSDTLFYLKKKKIHKMIDKSRKLYNFQSCQEFLFRLARYAKSKADTVVLNKVNT